MRGDGYVCPSSLIPWNEQRQGWLVANELIRHSSLVNEPGSISGSGLSLPTSPSIAVGESGTGEAGHIYLVWGHGSLSSNYEAVFVVLIYCLTVFLIRRGMYKDRAI